MHPQFCEMPGQCSYAGPQEYKVTAIDMVEDWRSRSSWVRIPSANHFHGCSLQQKTLMSARFENLSITNWTMAQKLPVDLRNH